MSDTTQTQCPTDHAVGILREREAALLEESRLIDARLAECREIIMLVSSRRPKAPRKPRTVREMIEGTPDPEEPSPRPTVFATPSLEAVADAS